MSRKELMAELVEVQNHPANLNRDIVSISALLTDDEMAIHLDRERAYLAKREAA